MTKDVIKLKNRRGGAGSILSGRALNVVTHIHIRERERERVILETDTKWRKQSRNEGRDWSDSATSQETPATKNWKRQVMDFLPELSERAQLCFGLLTFVREYIFVDFSHQVCFVTAAKGN